MPRKRPSTKPEASPEEATVEPMRALVIAHEVVAAELVEALTSVGAAVRTGTLETSLADTLEWRPHAVLVTVDDSPQGAANRLAQLRREHPCTVVAVGPATGELMTAASALNADVVLTSPIGLSNLETVLSYAAQRTFAGPSDAKPVPLPKVVVGSSARMREVWRHAMVAARSELPVVVTGETGVGKEIVARTLHRFSLRRDGPFIAVNCAALPENLLETELFGHEKGAFTGAIAQHKGRFELAHKGTLFLDEVGDLPLTLQVKLLRALQEQSFERVGGTQNISVDVRVVAATHHDLAEAIKREKFRADLFYRLHVLSIRVPPLRERKADILELWNQVIAERSGSGRTRFTTSPSVERILLQYDWPGNIRELHNVAQHALTVATDGSISPADLPEQMYKEADGAHWGRALVGKKMAEIERATILETYEAVGSVGATAELLGLSPRTIHYRLKAYRDEALAPKGKKAPSESAPVADDEVAARTRPRKIRVLLAEDDDELRWALSDVLKAEGYEVIGVPNGRALLEHLGASLLLEERGSPPDLIVTDVRMPGLTGMQILESVRDRGWTTPVVLVSGFGDEETHRRASVLGATAFLDKPINLNELRAILQNAVASPRPS
ncbi:MAG: sigma 54-interacting transcriptional regulator [Archangium sp.]|nr:sigma 54-interacting transcriptional regulator [Archangium sp.]